MATYPTDPKFTATALGDVTTDPHDETNVVEIAAFRVSRYERNSRPLPHLGDDPDWTPATFDLPSLIDDTPKRWFDRFRR